MASIEWGEGYPEQMIQGNGATVCGRKGFMLMPGIMSRMGLKRCPRCCKAMGIRRGHGNPENEDIMEPGDTPFAPRLNAST